MPKKPSAAERRMSTLFEEEALQNRQKWVAKYTPGTMFVRKSGWGNPGQGFTASPVRQFIKEHLCVLVGWRHILDKSISKEVLDPKNFEAVLLSPILGLLVATWSDFDEFNYRVFDASWKDRS